MPPSETSIQVRPSRPTAAAKPEAKPTVAKAIAAPVRAARRQRAKPAGRRSAQPGDLDRLARRLEADWQTALRKHEEAVHRKFLDLRTALQKPKAPRLKGRREAELREALAPRLKPTKGRAKDLRRVEDALGAALSRIP